MRAAFVIFALACGLSLMGCRGSQKPTSDSAPIANATSSAPPFATKEPERYQATRTVTFTESATNAATPVSETRTTRVLLARDGEQRREEYEAGALGTVIYLENQSGRFVLLPQAKLYADLETGSGEAGLSELKIESDSVSPDLLLHESTLTSRYQTLGAETIGGRATTKYHVTTTGETNATVVSETFIWIDEALGMLIKSESVHNDADRSTKALMELSDIRSDVDPKLFALPADYRKVAPSQIVAMIRQSANERRPAPEQNAPEKK